MKKSCRIQFSVMSFPNSYFIDIPSHGDDPSISIPSVNLEEIIPSEVPNARDTKPLTDSPGRSMVNQDSSVNSSVPNIALPRQNPISYPIQQDNHTIRLSDIAIPPQFHFYDAKTGKEIPTSEIRPGNYDLEVKLYITPKDNSVLSENYETNKSGDLSNLKYGDRPVVQEFSFGQLEHPQDGDCYRNNTPENSTMPIIAGDRQEVQEVSFPHPQDGEYDQENTQENYNIVPFQHEPIAYDDPIVSSQDESSDDSDSQHKGKTSFHGKEFALMEAAKKVYINGQTISSIEPKPIRDKLYNNNSKYHFKKHFELFQRRYPTWNRVHLLNTLVLAHLHAFDRIDYTNQYEMEVFQYVQNQRRAVNHFLSVKKRR